MSNLYIGQMRDTVRNFYKAGQDYKKTIAQNEKMYVYDYLDKANGEAMAKFSNAYSKAENTIHDIFNTCRTYLSIASFPNVEFSTADEKYFRGSDYNLSPQIVEAFVQRYENNPEMTREISQWIVRNHGDGMNEYTAILRSIVTPADQCEIYRQFAQSALSLITTIYTANDMPTLESRVMAFADESFSSELFAKVGNGMNLSDNKSRKVPELARHLLDTIELK